MNSPQFVKLKTYFKNRDDVLMAFLFGSQANGIGTKRSDWDIGVYLKPKSGRLEWDIGELYPQRGEIWRELSEILNTDREAEDYRQTAQEYADIYWRSKFLTLRDRDRLNKH